MIDRRPDRRQADSDVHSVLDAEHFHRTVALVVIHRDHQVEIAALGAKEERVGREGALDVEGLKRAVDEAHRAQAPVVLLATSFALVFLLDALAGSGLPLPAGSRAMQTGGYKGRTREVPAAELRAQAAATFALDPRAIVSEYGMTELSSQAYEGTLRGLLGLPGGAGAGVLAAPPWMRITAVDPATLAPVQRGGEGIARIVDLANVDSAVAVQTQDRVREVAGGVELLGRLPGAPPRGCSLAIEEMLDGRP